MRQLREKLRAFSYRSLVFLKMPLSWQIALIPKQLFTHEVFIVPLSLIRLYSVSDPSPPKHSFRFCFPTSEEKKFLPLPSVFDEMTDDNHRSCVHNTVRDIFIHGKDFRETSQYKRMLKGLADGNALYQCEIPGDIDLYFDHLSQAYHSIKEDGYKSQRELGKASKDEIRIHLTENGSFSLGSKGNHRLRMAELLGVRHIPCNVYGVNARWLKSLSMKTGDPPHVALVNWVNSVGDRVTHSLRVS
jgi:hypothetical protein